MSAVPEPEPGVLRNTTFSAKHLSVGEFTRCFMLGQRLIHNERRQLEGDY